MVQYVFIEMMYWEKAGIVMDLENTFPVNYMVCNGKPYHNNTIYWDIPFLSNYCDTLQSSATWRAGFWRAAGRRRSAAESPWRGPPAARRLHPGYRDPGVCR